MVMRRVSAPDSFSSPFKSGRKLTQYETVSSIPQRSGGVPLEFFCPPGSVAASGKSVFTPLGSDQSSPSTANVLNAVTGSRHGTSKVMWKKFGPRWWGFDERTEKHTQSVSGEKKGFAKDFIYTSIPPFLLLPGREFFFFFFFFFNSPILIALGISLVGFGFFSHFRMQLVLPSM